MDGLDGSEVARLRDHVPREAKPSPLYQGAWELIEQARKIRGFELDDEMKKWAGFVRASWFVYKTKGSIPLHLFARLLVKLGLRYDLEVAPAHGVRKHTGAQQGASMPQDTEQARTAADTLNEITDPGMRTELLNVLLRAVIKARKPSHPPPPAAAYMGPPRDRT